MTKDEAQKILFKRRKDLKITNSVELPDRFAFVAMPKTADPNTWTGIATYVYKNDGHIGYGIPTVEELKHAK